MPEASSDARVTRTRAALERSLALLIVCRRYDEFSVADICARAGVSRSSFYAHYRSKDALLAASIAAPFALLAQTVAEAFVEERLTALLQHFWANRTAARGILLGSARCKTAAVLVGLMEAQLNARGLGRRGALRLTRRLAAVALAEVLLAPLTAWLLGESRCTARDLARGLRRLSVAALESLR